MAHESFENKTTAKIMNDSFINIKADRKKSPGLDKTYQPTLPTTVRLSIVDALNAVVRVHFLVLLRVPLLILG
jgi:hypothetical protein